MKEEIPLALILSQSYFILPPFLALLSREARSLPVERFRERELLDARVVTR